jgi:peptide/nickel transport system substrate-binding protein
MNRRIYTGAVLALTAALSVSACSGKSSTSGSPGSATGSSAASAPAGSSSGSAPASSGASSSSASSAPASQPTTTDNSPARANSECDKAPDTCNTGTVSAQGTSFAYTIEKDIQDWDLLTSAGNTFDTAEALDGVYSNAFTPQPDLGYALNTDMFTSIEQTSTSPQTIVYKINPSAVWSDGTPITADDLILTWKLQNTKACGGADPNNTSANAPTFCDPASTSGYDNGKTATLVYATPFSDWKSLFGPIMPDHIAKANGGDQTKAQLSAATTYFSKTVPTWSSGPYLISKFEKNTAVTEVPNPKWYGKTPPGYKTVVFRILTDATTEAPALKSGEVQAINPQPEIDLVKAVQGQKGVLYHIGSGLIWEHFDLNLKNKALQNVAVRQAIFTAANRKALIARTIGQFDPNVKPMDSHMFVPGQKGYQANLPSSQGSGDTAAATKLLTAAGYKISGGKLMQPDGTAFPTLTGRYTVGNQIRQNEMAELTRDLKKIGITLNVQTTDDLGASLTHTAGKDYDIIVFAWQETPAVYSGAQQTWLSTSGSNYGSYKNAQVDALLNKAVAETDPTKANQELNDADVIMSKDAYVLPLYQKPTFLAFKTGVVNLRDNATSAGPPYNVGEWGPGKVTAQ